jgi:hypothetical protein
MARGGRPLLANWVRLDGLNPYLQSRSDQALARARVACAKVPPATVSTVWFGR